MRFPRSRAYQGAQAARIVPISEYGPPIGEPLADVTTSADMFACPVTPALSVKAMLILYCVERGPTAVGGMEGAANACCEEQGSDPITDPLTATATGEAAQPQDGETTMRPAALDANSGACS